VFSVDGPWAGTARPKWPWHMGGTARRNGPCAVSWAEGLAHGTARHGTAGTAARRGTAQYRASTARPCRVPCRHGTVANYRREREEEKGDVAAWPHY